MDHSQHSIHNHDHHSMHTGDMTTMPSNWAMSGGVLATTTSSPMDMMGSADSGMNGGMHDHYNMHRNLGGDGHGGHGGHGSDGMNMVQHAMSMAFHFGCNETILFSWWRIDSTLGLIGSMIAIFLLAILYEGLKYYREYLFWKTYNLLEYRPVTGPQRSSESGQGPPSTSTASPVQYVGEVIHKQPPTMLSLNHVYQTFLHIIQVTVSFLLMLIFMTYNVWLCIAVVLGAAVGYFLFCWKKSVIVDVTEHCH